MFGGPPRLLAHRCVHPTHPFRPQELRHNSALGGTAKPWVARQEALSLPLLPIPAF